MPRFPGFIGASSQAQTVVGDAERTVNFQIELLQGEAAKAPKALVPTPGFRAFTQGIPDVGTRGGIVANGRVFFVIATGLYEVQADGTWTKRNPALPLAQDNTPATLAYNGLAGGHVAIASGGHLYCFVLATNAITQVLTGEATMVAFNNGRFLAFNILNGHVRISALNDGTTWDPTLFFARSQAADPWQAMCVDGQGLIWLPGTESYEAWYVTQDANNPFAPLSGLVGPYGIAASFAWGVAGTQVFWLSSNRQGAGPIISPQGGGRAISSGAVNLAIAGYQRTSRITDAECLVYQDQGHTTPVWAFPSAPATWALQVELGAWTERGHWNPALSRYDLWSPRVQVAAFGTHLVGDRTTGTIAVMDATIGTELDGTGIRRLRCAGFTNEHKRQPIQQLELYMDTGVGVVVGADQQLDPQALLRISEDGGKRFGNERRCGFGRLGETRRRCYWTRLGAPADAFFETVFATAVPVRIVDAYVNNAEQTA